MSRWIRMVVGFGVLAIWIAPTAAEAGWTGWFSDENRNFVSCPRNQYANGFQCSGKYCDNRRLHCTGSIAFAEIKDHQGFVTDEQGNRSRGFGACPDGWYLVGILCTGRYCDNQHFRCARRISSYQRKHVGCSWTQWFSEETRPNAAACPAGKHIVGLGCSGRYCDNIRLYCCSPPPSASCGSGYYVNSSGSCSRCSAGTYKSGTNGATSCSRCPAGRYSSSGASSCSTCRAGTYSSSGASSCSTCSAGTYSSSGASSCSRCSAGTYSSSGASSCSRCSGGSYSSSGASSCSRCGAGTYSSSGASSCSRCSAGTYAAGLGNSSCRTCSAGTYSSSGATSCNRCPAGTYSSSGASSCSKCAAGSYSNSGASSCFQCRAGTYPDPALKSCISPRTCIRFKLYSNGRVYVNPYEKGWKSSWCNVETPQQRVSCRGRTLRGLEAYLPKGKTNPCEFSWKRSGRRFADGGVLWSIELIR
ncbi:MAG: hypothetical protein EP343_08175 [Deltaproteobacteria bacterium]|nr:MAG: hypothetical protein EP343_08175 [Deltaproteobacteria bacterium]